MQKENEVVESKIDKYIGQRCYPIGESQYGKLFAEIKNVGYEQFVIRVIISANESNVHERYRAMGVLSDIQQLNLTKDQITFKTIEAANEWLINFANEKNLDVNWT